MGTMTTRRPMLIRLGLLAALAVVAVLVVVVVTTPHRTRAQAAATAARRDRCPRSTASRSRASRWARRTRRSRSSSSPTSSAPSAPSTSANVLPELLDRYVKTGQVRLELRLLRFLGPDSDRLARVAAAASAQDRMWQFVGARLRAPGRARTPAMPPTTSSTGSPPTPASRSLDAGAAAERQVRRSEQAARTLGIESTPSFLIGPTGGDARRASSPPT